MCSERSRFGLECWSHTATKQTAVRRKHHQLLRILFESAVRRECCSDMAGKFPEASDQGGGVVEREHLVVASNLVISNLKPSERYGPHVRLGLDHQSDQRRPALMRTASPTSAAPCAASIGSSRREGSDHHRRRYPGVGRCAPVAPPSSSRPLALCCPTPTRHWTYRRALRRWPWRLAPTPTRGGDRDRPRAFTTPPAERQDYCRAR